MNKILINIKKKPTHPKTNNNSKNFKQKEKKNLIKKMIKTKSNKKRFLKIRISLEIKESIDSS